MASPKRRNTSQAARLFGHSVVIPSQWYQLRQFQRTCLVAGIGKGCVIRGPYGSVSSLTEHHAPFADEGGDVVVSEAVADVEGHQPGYRVPRRRTG